MFKTIGMDNVQEAWDKHYRSGECARMQRQGAPKKVPHHKNFFNWDTFENEKFVENDQKMNLDLKFSWNHN